ncbi:MAG: hypothetical protein ACE5QW_00795 [Thermoplasmata archaeon]
MSTTIQVGKKTLELLRKLKEEEGVETYEELIRSLIRSSKTLKVSQRGRYPKLKPFKREEIDRL